MNEKIALLRRYNFWGSDSIDLGYKRSTYVDNIAGYIGSKLIRVLVGQRRSGKSYILRQIAGELIDSGINPNNILFINKEFTDLEFLKNYKDLDEVIKAYKKELNPVGKIYIFIDEIQMIDGWEKVVNSYSQDYSESYELFISVSNSKMLSGELATLLSGRYISLEVFPFSYQEYLGITQQQCGRQSYSDYMSSGGLPELFMLNKPELKRNYVSAIKDTVLLRDIIQRYNVRDAKLLEDIFAFLVNNASNLVSIANIVNFFKSQGRKTSYDAVSNYIGYIEDAFLIHKCDRYNIKGKDIMSGNAKYYINDLAYKNYLYPGYGYGYGYLAENLVYLELKRTGYNVYVGSLRNKEVDFIANGDVARVVRVLKRTDMYGFRFADVQLYFPDLEVEMEAKILLDTLASESPSLTREQQETLFAQVLADYYDVTTKREKMKRLKTDPWFNALQVKYAYGVTCHKAQGGQWKHVYVDMGYIPQGAVSLDFYRWLYTAFTRATEKIWLVNMSEEFRESSL